MRFYQGVGGHTYVSADRCYLLLSLAKHALLVPGDFAECGVCRGGTALLLARVMRASAKKRHLFLFDSFEGLPVPTPDRDNFYGEGAFSFRDVEAVEKLLEGGEDFSVHKGWIPETFEDLGDKRFSFVHVDVDLYKSALDCCEFFYPRITAGGVMVFDDYGFPACRGEKDAVDEFFAGRPEKPFVLPTGQGVVLRV
jgi:hypothetical protein